MSNLSPLSAFKAGDSVVLCLQLKFGVSCKKISPEMYYGNSVLAPSGISVLSPWKFASLHATNAEFADCLFFLLISESFIALRNCSSYILIVLSDF